MDVAQRSTVFLQYKEGIVASLRTRLSAVALVATILFATTSSLVGAGEQPCATIHHHCADVRMIGQCRCWMGSESSFPVGPTEGRMRIGADWTPLSYVWQSGDTVSPFAICVQVHMSPTGISPLDLPTLFASLLI